MKSGVFQAAGPLPKNLALLAIEFVLAESVSEHPGVFALDPDGELIFTAACGRVENVSIAMRHARWFYFSMTLAQQKAAYAAILKSVGVSKMDPACFKQIPNVPEGLFQADALNIGTYVGSSATLNEMLRFGFVPASVDDAVSNFYRALFLVNTVNKLAAAPSEPRAVVRYEQYMPANVSKDFLAVRLMRLAAGKARTQACFSTSGNPKGNDHARFSLEFPFAYGNDVSQLIAGYHDKPMIGSEAEVIFPPGLGIQVDEVKVNEKGGVDLKASFYQGPDLDAQDFYKIDLALKQAKTSCAEGFARRIRSVFYVERVVAFLLQTTQDANLREALSELSLQDVELIKLAIVSESEVQLAQIEARQVLQCVYALSSRCDALLYKEDEQEVSAIFVKKPEDRAHWKALVDFVWRANLTTVTLPLGRKYVIRCWHELAAMSSLEALPKEVAVAIERLVGSSKKQGCLARGERMGGMSRLGPPITYSDSPWRGRLFAESDAYRETVAAFEAEGISVKELYANPKAFFASEDQSTNGFTAAEERAFLRAALNVPRPVN